MVRGREHTSAPVAKKRLRKLVSSDRCGCTTSELEMLQSDLFRVIERYLSIAPEKLQVTITNENIEIKLQSGENY